MISCVQLVINLYIFFLIELFCLPKIMWRKYKTLLQLHPNWLYMKNPLPVLIKFLLEIVRRSFTFIRVEVWLKQSVRLIILLAFSCRILLKRLTTVCTLDRTCFSSFTPQPTDPRLKKLLCCASTF